MSNIMMCVENAGREGELCIKAWGECDSSVCNSQELVKLGDMGG